MQFSWSGSLQFLTLNQRGLNYCLRVVRPDVAEDFAHAPQHSIVAVSLRHLEGVARSV